MIRRTLALAICTLAVCAAPAAAQLPAGGFSSPGVEFVKNISTGPSSGGKRVGDFFYLTTGRELLIYDIRTPEDPVEVGSLMLTSPGAADQRAPKEDPDTNGKLLFTTNGGNFQVYDISDPAAPKLAAELEGLDQHTVSCVLDCTWVYGSEGAIVDVRDPGNPKLAEENWLDQVEAGSPHDVTEVSPGIVMSSTQPIVLMDVRADPLHPKVLRTAEPPGFTHQVLWPHGGTEEIGFFLPTGSRSSAAYWISDRVLYIADYYRGLDVVKWTGEIPPSAPAPPAGSAPAPIAGPAKPPARQASFDDFVKLPPAKTCLRRVAIRVRRHAGDPVTALTVRAGRRRAVRVRGKRLSKPVVVRLRAKRVTVQVRVRTRSGFATAGGRTYRRCR